MLKQKEHKGQIRIDTPPPYARSDARSVGSRSNRWHKSQGNSFHIPMVAASHGANQSFRAQSQKYNYSRSKTLHRARSDSSISQEMSHLDADDARQKQHRRKRSFMSMKVLPGQNIEQDPILEYSVQRGKSQQSIHREAKDRKRDMTPSNKRRRKKQGADKSYSR